MQISSYSAPLPNTVAPFSVKVDPPSSGVTKDTLSSTFSPLSELSKPASVNNSLSQSIDIYSPQSLSRKVSGSNDVSNGAENRSPPVTGKETTDNSVIDSSSSVGRGDSSTDSVILAPSGGPDTAGVSQFPEPNGDVEGEGLTPPVQAIGDGEEQSENTAPASTGRLSPEELEMIQELSARDREVRTHEQQHQSAGGQYAGSASFSYQTGPDGVQYAVGGEVSIDISSVPNNPQATIDKMRTVRNAALAPAEPSSQDRSVAEAANRIMLQAQSELASSRAEERQVQAERAEQNKEQRVEDREQQQERQRRVSADTSIGVRAYENLIELGRQLDNGLPPAINLDEVV